MTLCAQKLKIRCAHKTDPAAVCVKLKATSKLSNLPYVVDSTVAT
jgi:hypothetical protein